LTTELGNPSCGTDTIIGFILPSDQSFTVASPSAPAIIHSGDSIAVKIQEDALYPHLAFDVVQVVIHSSSGAYDTVRIKVGGTINTPAHKLNFSSLLKFDSLAPCTPFD